MRSDGIVKGLEMIKSKINIWTVLAVGLLLLEVLAIVLLGSVYANNHMYSTVSIVEFPEGMYLTIKEDTILTYHDEEVLLPKGSLVKPDDSFPDSVSFYFAKDEKAFKALTEMDEGESMLRLEELGIMYFSHNSTSLFVEQAEIDSMREEVIRRNKAQWKDIKTKATIYTAAISLCWLIIGGLLVFLLSKKGWYALLYIIEILVIIITALVIPNVFMIF